MGYTYPLEKYKCVVTPCNNYHGDCVSVKVKAHYEKSPGMSLLTLSVVKIVPGMGKVYMGIFLGSPLPCIIFQGSVNVQQKL